LREKVFRTVIRQSVSLAEAPARSMDVLTYRPNGRGAEDYRALAQEVLRHG
jgi:chromosome partitioning protein